MKIVNINASSNKTSSLSTAYAEKLVAKLVSKNSGATVKTRHTTFDKTPFIDDAILDGLFVNGERTAAQKEALKFSDELTNELIESDVLVIGTPIYNFSVPASLKAYFDLIARAGLTFKYGEQGPVGLLENKKAYVVITSGGVKVGSEADFAGNYIKQFLGFLEITDVEFIPLDLLMFDSETKIAEADKQIAELY
jgi:FMN-dependent NADH-azoreductase